MATATKANSSARKKVQVEKIIERLEKVHPDAKLDLDFTNPLELLVCSHPGSASPRRSRQPSDRRSFQEIPNRGRLRQRDACPKLQSQINKINFYRNKAKSIHNCCSEIVKRFKGKVPDKAWTTFSALPGVGRKTANIVLGNAFGQQTIGVDTHVMRLSQRLGLTKNTNPDKIEFDLTPLVPEKQRVRFCHLLQYHGRRICVAKSPRCPVCTIKSLCPYPNKTKS